MIILVVGVVIIVAIVGIAALVYLARHPKCPRCGRRFNCAVPVVRQRAEPIYFCVGCLKFIPFEEIRPRRFR